MRNRDYVIVEGVGGWGGAGERGLFSFVDQFVRFINVSSFQFMNLKLDHGCFFLLKIRSLWNVRPYQAVHLEIA